MWNKARVGVDLITLSHALVYEVVVALRYHSLNRKIVHIIVKDLGRPKKDKKKVLVRMIGGERLIDMRPEEKELKK